jgi:hypothetical protein
MKQTRKPAEPDHSSPKWTFVARFNDGVVTRMTTFCTDGKFDLERDIAVARAAYESKTGSNNPPAIVAAKFIEPGYEDTILKEYDAVARDDNQPNTAPLRSSWGGALVLAGDADAQRHPRQQTTARRK